MAKGRSGRIVIEIDPELKRQLYSALAMDALTLKEWFVNLAQRRIAEGGSSNLAIRSARSKKANPKDQKR